MKIHAYLKRLGSYSALFSVFVFFAFPVSTSYKLKSFEFGGGGGITDSGSYSMEGVVGEIAGAQTSGSYSVNSGLAFVQQTNTPDAPTLQNNGNWYNKLLLIINTSNNPSDTKYAVAISSDNFVTTQYVQSDNTVGNTLGIEDYQTYANWGSGTGEYIIGLNPAVTYKVKVKALQGKYTEGPWGPATSGVATSNVNISFDIDIGTTSSANTSAPYSVSMGELTLGGVTTASNQVWVDLDTNADLGAYVYVYDAYGGLKASNINYTIASASTDLGTATEGFGIRTGSVSETAGGPLTAISPYNGASDNVGIVNTTVREIFSTSSSSITGGRGSILIKAKTSNVTPSSSDYTDTLTLVAAATF
jgi:hypothetical protein